MCGITGFFSRNPVSREVIDSMTETLNHRGPDARGVFISEDGNCALGHTRLSIIDLSQKACQPMFSADGRYVIVFNGEVYNFKAVGQQLKSLDHTIQFRTHSDTEIILHAFNQWGFDIADKLEGMFAFAIYDNVKKELFFVRDRAGKKPLFYYKDENHFVFASEIKALLKHPIVNGNKKINYGALYKFLHVGYIPEPSSIYDKISKFPAGYTGILNNKFDFTLKPYWKIEDRLDKSTMFNLATTIDELKTRLLNAVESRMISDVPLGTFLSGGIDSSLISAMASRLSAEPLKTFNIGFENAVFDETEYARKVAKHLKADHHEFILTEKDASILLETYLHHFDEPFADTSAIPTMMVSKITKKYVTVALTGDGGDELFLGYGAYDWAERLDNIFFRMLQPSAYFLLKQSSDNRLRRISSMLQPVHKSVLRSHIFSQDQYLFSDNELKNILCKPHEYLPLGYTEVNLDGFTPAERQALFDFKFYLKDDLLVKVDRASMLYGLECRCPFLDHNVVELAFNMPLNFKKQGSVRKWILKEILSDYLPKELIHRQKWGFSIPLSKWLKNDLRYLINDYLSESVVHQFGIIKPASVEELKRRFFKGEDYLYNRLWVLIVAHKWLKEHA